MAKKSCKLRTVLPTKWFENVFKIKDLPWLQEIKSQRR